MNQFLKRRIAYIASIDTDEASGPSSHILGAVAAMARSHEVELWRATTGSPFTSSSTSGWRESKLPFPTRRGGWRLFELALLAKILTGASRFDILYVRISPSRLIAHALARVQAFKVLELNGLESIEHTGFLALSRSMDLILVTSEASKRNLVARYPELAPKIQTHFQVGVDLSLYFPADQQAERHALGLRADGRYVLHTSGFQPHHDFETLFRAMKQAATRTRDLELLLVGDGPRRADISELAEQMQMGALVRFIGSVPQQRLRHWIAAADACVNPMTPAKLEECGNLNALKTYEYVACGTPAIESFTPNHPLPAWANQHLLLVPANDAASLANAILEGIRRKHESPEALRVARAYVAGEHTWEAVTKHSLGHVEAALRARTAE